MRHSPRRLRRAGAGLLALTLAATGCSERLPTDAVPGSDLSPARRSADLAVPTPVNHIRIGVLPSAGSVTLGSGADYRVLDRQSGDLLLSGSAGSVTVTLESVAASWYRLQVACVSESTVAEWQARAEAAGYPTLTEPVPTAGCTRLFIGRFDPPPASTFSARVAFKNQLVAEGLAGTDAFWKVVADPGVTLYSVQRGSETATSTGPVLLTSSDGVVTIDGVRYRGAAEAHVNGAGSLAGVNEVFIEDYLKGVVPSELPPTIWPALEAQKAQAVAARTYALSGLGKRAGDGYDLLATTSDQVYGGLDVEQPLSSQAVDETRGVVATYDGKLISALFSSTSGGHTADNEEVFSSAPIPYLRGVPDAERGVALEHVPSLEVFKASADPASLRAMRSGDAEADWSRYHRWTFEWSADEISDVISAYAGQPVGRVLAIDVTERGPSGRVLRIDYVTEAGTFTDTKDHIRSSLKFINASGGTSSLLSTLFFIEPVTDRGTGEVTGFRAYGGGWGHGVGLSQTGAVGLAEKGHGYEEILKHYYQGIALETKY